jgi:hypothetical protein
VPTKNGGFGAGGCRFEVFRRFASGAQVATDDLTDRLAGFSSRMPQQLAGFTVSVPIRFGSCLTCLLPVCCGTSIAAPDSGPLVHTTVQDATIAVSVCAATSLEAEQHAEITVK